LPNVGPYIYDVSISGFTRSSIYIYDISSLRVKTNIHFWSYLAQFFLEWEIFQIKVVQKIKTHILCSVTFYFFEKRAVYEIMWKIQYSRRSHRWQYGACAFHAEYLRLQNDTLGICNTFCSSTANNGATMPHYTCIACLVIHVRTATCFFPLHLRAIIIILFLCQSS